MVGCALGSAIFERNGALCHIHDQLFVERPPALHVRIKERVRENIELFAIVQNVLNRVRMLIRSIVKTSHPSRNRFGQTEICDIS